MNLNEAYAEIVEAEKLIDSAYKKIIAVCRTLLELISIKKNLKSKLKKENNGEKEK